MEGVEGSRDVHALMSGWTGVRESCMHAMRLLVWCPEPEAMVVLIISMECLQPIHAFRRD